MLYPGVLEVDMFQPGLLIHPILGKSRNPTKFETCLTSHEGAVYQDDGDGEETLRIAELMNASR